MDREIHKIYDASLKLLMLDYANEFLTYIGEEKSMKQILKTEITTKKGRTLFLDFLCELTDGTLLNIEFQFTGPDKYDLERFYDYNSFSQTEHDTHCETIIINLKSSKSGQKSRKIGKTKTIHPPLIHLGDIDFKKILNNIENKAKNNQKLTNQDEISLMLMSLLPKYKNKEKVLGKICKILKKENLFDKTKITTFKAVIGLEIENLVNKDIKNELKGELNMTPEQKEMMINALNEVSRKYLQIEKEELLEKGRKQGIKEGKIEGKIEGKSEGKIEGKKESQIEIAKKLKEYHTPEEISKITGLTLATILKL